MILESYAKDEERQAALIEAWQETGGKALQSRGTFLVALSARPVTLECLRQLSQDEWPWSATHLYLSDENWVPRSNSHNHHRQVYAACRPRPVQLHGWETENLDPHLSASRFEKHLLQELGKPPQFDLAILEAGSHGQVSALYPGCPALLDTEVYAINQEVPERRLHQLTLTILTYLRAREIWLITNRAEHKYWEKDPDSPAGRLIQEGRELKIFLTE